MIKVLRIAIPLLALVFFLLVMASVQEILRHINPRGGGGQVLEHQYALFLPEGDYFYYTELERGARDAADAMHSGLLVMPLSDSGIELLHAGRSGFDGMALYPPSYGEDLSTRLEAVQATGIPLVLIDHDVPLSGSSYFVGSSSYDSGRGIGKLASDTAGEDINMTLMYSRKNPGLLGDAAMLEMGITEILGERLASLHTLTSGRNPLDAENMLHDCISSGRIGNLIVLTDQNDTLVAAQTIIDMNLVGRIQIIGFGDSPIVRDYIEKGIILGSIVRNPYRIGFSSIMALNELRLNGYTSAYVDTGISILGSDEQIVPVRDYGPGPP